MQIIIRKQTRPMKLEAKLITPSALEWMDTLQFSHVERIDFWNHDSTGEAL